MAAGSTVPMGAAVPIGAAEPMGARVASDVAAVAATPPSTTALEAPMTPKDPIAPAADETAGGARASAAVVATTPA